MVAACLWSSKKKRYFHQSSLTGLAPRKDQKMETNFYNIASHLSEADIASNEVDVRALYQQLIDAWGDTDAYAALFTEDGDYVAFDGSHARGRTEIASAHRPLF